MADVKISQLPLATAVHADDTLEKSDHNATPSQRCTPLQIMTYLQTAFPSLSWASGVSNLQPNGDIFVGAGNLAIINAADGSASFGATKILLNSDGSTSFASGLTTFGAAGGMATAGGAIDCGGGANVLNPDGSTSFSNGIVIIGSSDNLTVDNGNGAIRLNSGTGGIDIAGTQILTSQQAAVADATTAVDVIARFNELLARVRASTGHGLISG